MITNSIDVYASTGGFVSDGYVWYNINGGTNIKLSTDIINSTCVYMGTIHGIPNGAILNIFPMDSGGSVYYGYNWNGNSSCPANSNIYCGPIGSTVVTSNTSWSITVFESANIVVPCTPA